MVRILRLGVLALVILGGCKKSQPAPPTAARFLPATADIAVRVDLSRAKVWSGYAKAAPVAFRSIAVAVEAVKKACDVDLLGDASSIILARHGTGATGDMTLVIDGLPRDKLAACPVKLGASIPPLEVVPDGDRFSVKLGGKGFASGAILASGELVLVSRAASSIEPAAWREEVTAGTGTAPTWWAELDQVQPIAVRTLSPDHTITLAIQLGDPLVVKGKSVAASAELAATDLARGKAILEFLTKAEAGVGRLEPRDNVVHGDLTATGPQVDHLVTAALAAIGGDQPAPQAPPVENTSPIECSEMTGAVTKYMAANMAAMDPAQRTSLLPMFAKLVPALEKAYVESCTTDNWPPGVIHCHVDHAEQLPRFEKCRLMLDPAPRAHFDQLVTAALSSAK